MDEYTGNKGKWEKIRKRLLNKYVITLLSATFIFVFIGDQSLIKCIDRARQMRKAEQQLEASRADIQQAQRTLQILQDTDSLERYAREHYNMHTDKEDVYLIGN